MKKYTEQRFTGERALFQVSDLEIENCTFLDGESPLKESKNLDIRKSMFQWKYPLWYSNDIYLEDCILFDTARAGIWYTKNITLKDTTVEAPKSFRRAENIILNNIVFPNAYETLWN